MDAVQTMATRSGSGAIRRATSADAAALRLFQCSKGASYQDEVEEYIHGTVADSLTGTHGVWVVEDDTGITGVTAHDGHPHPDGGDAEITCITVAAVRVDRQGRGRVVQQLLTTVLEDAQASERDPVAFARVAAENAVTRRYLEHRGFIFAPVPSDPRYLYYMIRLR